MVDEITRASMIALLARWQIAWASQQKQHAIRDEAAKKALESGKIIMECRATAKSLGFDRDDKDSWDKAIADFVPGAQELYAKVKEPDMPLWEWALKREPEIDANMQDESGHLETPSTRPSIRQIVLDRLEHAGAAGAKAAEIRAYIETTYNEEIHEKTVGMTLYRLLQDVKVRRQGHTWFLVPQNIAETKNPGGETPGLIEDLL